MADKENFSWGDVVGKFVSRRFLTCSETEGMLHRLRGMDAPGSSSSSSSSSGSGGSGGSSSSGSSGGSSSSSTNNDAVSMLPQSIPRT